MLRLDFLGQSAVISVQFTQFTVEVRQSQFQPRIGKKTLDFNVVQGHRCW